MGGATTSRLVKGPLSYILSAVSFLCCVQQLFGLDADHRVLMVFLWTVLGQAVWCILEDLSQDQKPDSLHHELNRLLAPYTLLSNDDPPREPYRPFDHLPTEIIHDILVHAVHQRNSLGYHRRSKDFRFPSVAQLVSKRFRDITLASPAMWTVIHIDGPAPLDHLVQHLLHSRSLPLEVVLTLPPDNEEGKVDSTISERAVDLLLPHRHRIATIQCPMTFIHTLFPSGRDDEETTGQLKNITLEPDHSSNRTPLSDFHLPAALDIYTLTIRMHFGGELRFNTTNIRRLCLYICIFKYQDYIDLLQGQPQLEEIAVLQCSIWDQAHITPSPTRAVLPALRRLQIVEQKDSTSQLLLGAFEAPELEDLETVLPEDDHPAPQEPQEAPNLIHTFPRLKRLRVSANQRTLAWIRPSLPSVAELHLVGYCSEHRDEQIKTFREFIQPCPKLEAAVFEDLPPLEIQEVLETYERTNLICIGVPWKLWGTLRTAGKGEFERAERNQQWLYDTFKVQLWDEPAFGVARRYSSWKTLQRGVDTVDEMIREQISDRMPKKVLIQPWDHVYDSTRDFAH